MNVATLTTFLQSQVGIVAAVFLAGFGAVYGISLIRYAIVRHGAKLASEAGGGGGYIAGSENMMRGRSRRSTSLDSAGTGGAGRYRRAGR